MVLQWLLLPEQQGMLGNSIGIGPKRQGNPVQQSIWCDASSLGFQFPLGGVWTDARGRLEFLSSETLEKCQGSGPRPKHSELLFPRSIHGQSSGPGIHPSQEST